MARIRTIKPEFPHSESMGAVSRDARLLFVLLWTIADDSGRLRGNSRLLASLLYPYDGDAGSLLDGWLTELEAQKCLIRYEVGGHSYVQITNWTDHQKIDKPSGSKLPEFVEPSRSLANIREVSSEEGKGRERKGVDQEGKVVDQKPKDNRELPIGIPPLREEVIGKMKELGFLDPEFEATKFFDYWEGLSWHRGKEPMKNWRSSCNTWKTNSVSRGEFPGLAPSLPSTSPYGEGFGTDWGFDPDTKQKEAYTDRGRELIAGVAA